MESTCLYYDMSLTQKLSVPNLHTFPSKEIIEALKIQRIDLYDPESILDSLEQLQRYIPLKSEVARKQNEVRKLVDDWFTYKVECAYQQLSPEIFKMERTVEIDPTKHEIVNPSDDYYPKEGTTTQVKIPFFLQASIHDARWQFAFDYNSQYNSRRYTYHISANIPKIPKGIRDEGKRALATPYEVYAEAMETRTLSDILLEDISLAPSPVNSQLLVLWKPRAEDLKVKVERIDRDPILLLKWNRPYLVSTWTEPAEEPFTDDLSVFKLAKRNSEMTNLDKILENSK